MDAGRNDAGVDGNAYTHPHVADEFLVAYGLVGLVDGWRALGTTAVAKARVPATVVVPALIAVAQSTAGCAAGALQQPEMNNALSAEEDGTSQGRIPVRACTVSGRNAPARFLGRS